MKKALMVSIAAHEENLIAGILSGAGKCNHVGRCIVGSLLVAAGVPEGTLDRSHCPTYDQEKLLFKTYGLHEEDIEVLMHANDSTPFNRGKQKIEDIMANRRDNVIGAIYAL